MADAHGTVWAVGERECSIQRRHQKIIEEAPSPLVERVPGMRARLFEAARLAAEAIGYTGAGTVEFLADDDGEFFFLEMNTRLQVEHPVTEATTGLDLVELQLQVADGVRTRRRTPCRTRAFDRGAALRRGPAPRTGSRRPARCTASRCPAPQRVRDRSASTGIRLDSGIVDGSTVSIHYDPMLAKVISYAPTRRHAALLLADALARTRLHGVRTNRDLLVNVLRHPAFLDGATDTAFFDTHGLAAAGRPAGRRCARRGCRRWPPPSPMPSTTAPRQRRCAAYPAAGAISSRAIRHKTLPGRPDDTEHRVEYRFTRDGVVLPDDDGVQLVSATPDQVVLADAAGAETPFDVSRYGDRRFRRLPAGRRRRSPRCPGSPNRAPRSRRARWWRRCPAW